MKLYQQLIIATTTFLLGNFPVQAFTVTVEQPTIQSEQLSDDLYVIDFDDLTINSTESFSKTNSTTSSTYTYDGDLVVSATTIFGGADNSSFIQPTITESESFHIQVSNKQKYFGFWWSAGDDSNTIIFKNKGEVIASFNTQNVIETISKLPNGSDYYCNPTPLFSGQVCEEPYVFINFFFENGESYDEIVVESPLGESNFESDNHTYSVNKQTIRGEVVFSESLVTVFAD